MGSGHRRSKRPLLRPPIPSPYTNASQPKVVYVSAKTPFISAVKRVRKLMAQAEKRAIGKVSLLDKDQGRSDKQKLQSVAAKPANPECVYLRATGRAIEKGLSLALYFQNQQDCNVRLKTGTVGTVDDIVETGEPVPQAQTDADMEMDDVDQPPANGGDEATGDIPETQIRRTSFLEVAVWLK